MFFLNKISLENNRGVGVNNRGIVIMVIDTISYFDAFQLIKINLNNLRKVFKFMF